MLYVYKYDLNNDEPDSDIKGENISMEDVGLTKRGAL
jgi:hypothetical protein